MKLCDDSVTSCFRQKKTSEGAMSQVRTSEKHICETYNIENLSSKSIVSKYFSKKVNRTANFTRSTTKSSSCLLKLKEMNESRLSLISYRLSPLRRLVGNLSLNLGTVRRSQSCGTLSKQTLTVFF